MDRRRAARRRAFPLFAALIASLASAAETISPDQAAQHVGQNVVVCGVVASAHYAPSTKGSPTFLSLGKPYPNQVFTALIWGGARPLFKQPPEQLKGKHICVSGAITSYKGSAEIVVQSPDQILVGAP